MRKLLEAKVEFSRAISCNTFGASRDNAFPVVPGLLLVDYAHPPQAPISEPPSIEEPPEPDPEFEQRLADIRAFSDYADANPPRFESAQTQPGTQWGDTSSPAAPDQQEGSNSADMMVPPVLPPSDSPLDSALGDVKAF